MPPPVLCSFLISQFSEYPADCLKSHICVQKDDDNKMHQDHGICHEFKHMFYLSDSKQEGRRAEYPPSPVVS